VLAQGQVLSLSESYKRIRSIRQKSKSDEVLDREFTYDCVLMIKICVEEGIPPEGIAKLIFRREEDIRHIIESAGIEYPCKKKRWWAVDKRHSVYPQGFFGTLEEGREWIRENVPNNKHKDWRLQHQDDWDKGWKEAHKVK